MRLCACSALARFTERPFFALRPSSLGADAALARGGVGGCITTSKASKGRGGGLSEQSNFLPSVIHLYYRLQTEKTKNHFFRSQYHIYKEE